MSAVRNWLEEIGLAQYGDAFEANDIDTVTRSWVRGCNSIRNCAEHFPVNSRLADSFPGSAVTEYPPFISDKFPNSLIYIGK